MSARNVQFYFIRVKKGALFVPDHDRLTKYLGGRPRDPRVKYATGVNKGKVYPYSSVRQNTRDARARERAARSIGQVIGKDDQQVQASA